MASKGALLLANNDNLETVIKKCNTNFKAILTQQSQAETIARQSQESSTEQITEEVAEAVGQAVDSMIGRIGDEARIRSSADQDLEDAIETVDGKFADYTLTADLAAVATSGDYNDLINTPVPEPDPVNTAYLTFDLTEDPNTTKGGTWVLAGTLTVGVETANMWKKTAL